MTMTLDAINGSIAKWTRVIHGGTERGTQDCPLCHIYLMDYGSYKPCKNCPVSIKTGQSACNKTPYDDWTDHHAKQHKDKIDGVGWKIECPECRRLAYKERDFLKSLLPD